ncbi:VOC family protein [Bradyrhizobium sp. NP1]|uniref:VOC family protein n=1 Tax=Bradyrhizobium sp. NP1 TaxID=3049772 RepID=UPI0025A50FAD|nr:VOC family protein [Bradyrhizobium sp. NP1]WJR76864.1 VOC family protein [Bradyrhizobium sp. NP1]
MADNRHGIPKQIFGPFNDFASLGIVRGNYIALCADEPEAAAEFAVRHMGFYLVHVDSAGRHYLAAGGHDPYSLVYTNGEHGKIDHISYVVNQASELVAAETRLAQIDVPIVRVEKSDLWRHGPALRVRNPGGATIELTVGVRTTEPMACNIFPSEKAPQPLCLDHAVIRAVDIPAAYDFAARVLGLQESGRICDPTDKPLLGFFRSGSDKGKLWHCYAVAASEYDGLHHVQFTLKNKNALEESHAAMEKDGKVNIIWRPMRHGPGHNIAYYFEDYTGNVIEYSTEEEIILDDASYVPRQWSTMESKSISEWDIREFPKIML